jgi:hypothetical protein
MSNQEPDPEKKPSKADMEFVHIFEEMSDILQYALENADKNIKIPLPKSLEDQMLKLENDVEEFCRMNDELIAKEKKPEIDPYLNMSQREKEVYDRSKVLVKRAEEKIAIIKDFLRTVASKGLEIENSPEEKKKHYKRFGLREKWKKM